MLTAPKQESTTRLTPSKSATRLDSSAASLRAAAGGLLTGALVLAPLQHASTRPDGIWLLVAVLAASAACWCGSCLLSRRVPPLPRLIWWGLAALACSLWPWLAGTAVPTAPAEFTQGQLARVIARWPHSVIRPDPGAFIALQAGLGLALVITADLARERRWLLLFSAAVVLTAVAVTLLALMQNFTAASGIFWRAEGRLPGRFWGTFFHHTSAGAYLNTAWPLAAALVVACRRLWPGTALPLAAGLALVLLLGAHASHVSRFPQVAAGVVLLILSVRLQLFSTARRRLWAAGALAAIVLLAVGAGRLGDIGARWQQFRPGAATVTRAVPPESAWPRLVRDDLLIPNVYNSSAWGDRGEIQRTALRAIAARPWTGHGPANWAAAASRHSSDPYVRSFYLHLQFAHEDFLQAAAERGLPALLGLLLLLPGAGLAVFFATPRFATDPLATATGFCAAAGLGAVLVQSLFDFPLQIPAVALNASLLAGLAWASVTSAPSVP